MRRGYECRGSAGGASDGSGRRTWCCYGSGAESHCGGFIGSSDDGLFLRVSFFLIWMLLLVEWCLLLAGGVLVVPMMTVGVIYLGGLVLSVLFTMVYEKKPTVVTTVSGAPTVSVNVRFTSVLSRLMTICHVPVFISSYAMSLV